MRKATEGDGGTVVVNWSEDGGADGFVSAGR